MLSKKQRVSSQAPCPVCGKGDWCFFSGDGTGIVCARVSDGATKRAGEAGWFHPIADATRRAVPRQAEPASFKDFERVWQSLQRNTPGGFIQDAAQSLRVGVRALECIGCAAYGTHGTAAFPMMNAARIIIGVRLRSSDGRKWAIRGSRQGLFIPSIESIDERLVVCEGPTDTAAMLTAGYSAIGRPSCRGCEKEIAEFCRRRDVVILSDADDPGRDGSISLAKAIWRACKTLRVAEPTGAKDARDWIRLVGLEVIQATIDNAERFRG